MTDDEFDAFVQQATEQLRAKQEQLTKGYGLGTYPDFWFDQEKGTLQFKDSCGHVGVEATIIPIGSFSTKSLTWQWAWANESVVGRLREKAESMKGLYELTGMNVFQTPVIEADEPMAWELAAMSVRYLESVGVYRMPTGGGKLMIFLAIESIASPK
jgi:hypothetical protein